LLRTFTITIKMITLFLALFSTGATLRAQLRVSGGTRLGLSGNVQFVLGGGSVVNNGTIGGTTGTLVFAGPVIFNGTGTTQVANLLVQHSSAVASVLNVPIDITNTATLMFGNLVTNENLVIRSDISTTANLVVAGIPTGPVEGLIARASPAYGPCPSFPSVLSVNISGPNLHYQWESSVDSASWTTLNGATLHDYNAVINGTVYYRCLVTSGTSFYDTLSAGKMGLDTVAAITGITTIATGNTAALSSVTAGGVWSSSNPSILQINANTGVITGVSTGSATVTYSVTNINSCTRNTTRSITVIPGAKPVVVVTNPSPVCAPATVDLTAPALIAGSSTGVTYTYYTDAAASTVLANPSQVTAAGTYYIVGTYTSSGIASDPIPVTVTIIQAQQVKALFNYNSYCVSQPVQFNNTSTISGPVTYSWSDNAGNNSTSTAPSFTYASAGNISVKLRVQSVSCPLVADSVTLVLPIEQPTPAIRMPKVTVGQGEQMELRARNFGTAYVWTPATGLSNTAIFNPKVSIPQEQEYRISIKTQSGCTTVDTLLVQVFDKRIYVPRVFTPNGDGVNDKLYVNVIGTNLRQLTSFRIYNRNSKLVFETTDATIGWDGRVNGVLQPMDTYVWAAEARDTNGALVVKSGNVTLLR
jgi:gliding motility-associated-like protein